MSTAVPDRSQRAPKRSKADAPEPANGRHQSDPTSLERLISNASCLLCGSNRLEVVRRIATERLVSEWNSTFQMDIRSELGERTEIVRLRCGSCDFDFFAPGDLTGSGAFYEGLQQFNWYYMPHKWEHQATLSLIQPGAKLLEVGCAEGSFLQRVMQDRQAAAIGLELNEQAVALARQSGLDVRAQLIESFAATQEALFDFVCAFQVLEHVSNPREFLAACLKVTKPGGRVVLGVPNEDSFLKYEWTLLNMPPHHVSIWRPGTFERLATKLHVSIESMQREPLAPYHIDQYLAAYAGHYRAKSRLHRLLFSRTLRKLWRSALRAGWHRRLAGQSLLVVLRKDGP